MRAFRDLSGRVGRQRRPVRLVARAEGRTGAARVGVSVADSKDGGSTL